MRNFRRIKQVCRLSEIITAHCKAARRVGNNTAPGVAQGSGYGY